MADKPHTHMPTDDIALTIVAATLAILLLIAGVIITMVLANRRHTQQEVKMAKMQVDYEKELRTVENEVQEQVLTNVAHELHDNIGQLLTLVRIQLEQEKLDNEELATKLEPADNTLNDVIEQVRMLSHNLNTEYLEKNGLIYAIDKEIERVSKVRSIKVNWSNDGKDPDFDKSNRIMIFRIFQEILNNALKHARAKNLVIQLTNEPNFIFTIQDDGKGFDKEATLQSSKGSGLQNILKRARLAGLHLEIESTMGKGSIFTLSHPRNG